MKLLLSSLLACAAIVGNSEAGVRIGNYYCSAPNGIAFIRDDAAAFVIDPGGAYTPDTAAPDDSFHRSSSPRAGFRSNSIGAGRGIWRWGRLSAPAPVNVTFKLGSNWPGFASRFTAEGNGVKGEASATDGKTIVWRAQTWPAPVSADGAQFTVAVDPAHPAHLVAGFGDLPSFPDIDGLLAKAEQAYLARRPKASGPAGDFLGAIADSLNGSRFYSSDDKRAAVSVSRGWIRGGANHNPYFCWDSFFSGLLASLDDPETGRETVRAILSCQTAEGLVPNYGHWMEKSRASDDRSQPPVGALCVWKMHQHWPDAAFLREVYPALAKWHAWWMTARDAKHDGLLEWGTATGNLQNAKYETGWDDTPEFEGAAMDGTTMNAYAVDLCSLWAMDAHYLALIADAIGKPDDAAKYRQERDDMNRRINDKLWNESLGIYCSRMWDGPDGKPGAFLTRLTPMNFYPLISGAPDADRARRVLEVMTDPARFWGDWILPTVAKGDPLFPQQIYWHGTVWGPVNYLVYQGVKRYAPPEVESQYARKSVALFMRNWTEKRICAEKLLEHDRSARPGALRPPLHLGRAAVPDRLGVGGRCRRRWKPADRPGIRAGRGARQCAAQRPRPAHLGQGRGGPVRLALGVSSSAPA